MTHNSTLDDIHDSAFEWIDADPLVDALDRAFDVVFTQA